MFDSHYIIKTAETIGSGTAVRPNTVPTYPESQLNPHVQWFRWLKIFNKGSNPAPQLNFQTDWRSSIGIKSRTPVTLLHSLKIFNKRSKFFDVEESEIAQKGQKGDFGKRVFEDPFSTFKLQSLFRSSPIPITCQNMLRQPLCTGNTTVLRPFALRRF